MNSKNITHKVLTFFFILSINISYSLADAPENMVIIPGENGNESFYMDKYEVTNVQYKVFIDNNPQWHKDNALVSIVGDTYLWGWKGNMYPKGRGNHPVVAVSWFAAKAYAEWVGKDLPTQAQWEKAARGSLIDKKYPWGDADPHNRANFDRYTPKVSFKIPPTMKVGSYPPNEYGLYDIVGNVDEWCLDRLDVDDIHRRYHILRGGSWFKSAEEFQISTISQHPVYDGIGTVGFRCVLPANGIMSSDVAFDMSTWIYENMQNGFDSALYSLSRGNITDSGLETKFDEIVKYFTKYPRTFEQELNQVFFDVIVVNNPYINSEDFCINTDTTLLLWKFYLEIHFKHNDKSLDEKLNLLRGCLLDKIDEIFMEDGRSDS